MAGLGVSAAYRVFGLGLPCPWRWLTGTLCPFCGATRMGADLLSFDVAGAWAENQFVFAAGVLLAMATVVWTVEALGGPALRLPRRLGEQRTWTIALVAAAAVFMVVRNL
jgi:hypothetical protein